MCPTRLMSAALTAAREPVASEPPVNMLADGRVETDRRLEPHKSEHGFGVGRASDFVHHLLFLQEYPLVKERPCRSRMSSLAFFLTRAGGFHLLLLLLNAAYQKPAVGRPPGWPFGVLAARIKVSERTLRKLLADGIAEGHVVRNRGQRDRRSSVFCITQTAIEQWEGLFGAMAQSVTDALEHLDGHGRADVDYSKWNMLRPAADQHPPRLVYKHLKSAVDPALKVRKPNYRGK